MKAIVSICIVLSLLSTSFAKETIKVKDGKEYVCEKMKRKIHKQPVKKYKCKPKDKK